MAWNDEILEAAYISPSGKRQTFIYENVSRETDLKTASFVFPELDGALIQSLGLGGRNFPLNCIFTGADCTKKADSFERLLGERGHGILEHPLYGKINVVPTGKIKRTDNLVSGANEAVVEVTFAETIIDTDFPYSEVGADDDLDEAMDEYEDAAVADFSANIQTETIEDKIQLQTVMKVQVNSSFKGVEKMAKASAQSQAKEGLLQQLDSMKRFINGNINDIDKIGTFAAETARSTVKLIRLPSKIAINALTKLTGYQTMIKNVANNIKADPFGAKAIVNQWATTSLVWSSMVASLSFGLAKTAGEQKSNSANDGSKENTGGFTSRADVIEAALQIITAFNEFSTYTDEQNKKNVFIDTGETYEKLLNVVTFSLRALENAAFDLPVTRIIKLDRDRQLFELLTEFYGKDGFNKQDQFINDNKLTADEIVLIPMGREVRYYA